MARFSARAADGFGGLFKGAGRKVLELSKKGGDTTPPWRTTSPAPNAGRSVEPQRLRQQSQASIANEDAATPRTRSPKKKLLIAAGSSALLISVAALAMHYSSAPPGAQGTQGTQGALGSAVASVAAPSVGARLSALPAPNDRATSGVVSANVPLFGPTPMATMEPAPLAPPPGSPQSVEAAEKADAKANSADAPVAASAADEGFSDESADGDAEKSDAKGAKDRGDKDGEKSTKTDTTP